MLNCSLCKAIHQKIRLSHFTLENISECNRVAMKIQIYKFLEDQRESKGMCNFDLLPVHIDHNPCKDSV